MAVVRLTLKGRALDEVTGIMKPTWRETKEAVYEKIAEVVTLESLSKMITALKQDVEESFNSYKSRTDKILTYNYA